MFAFTKPAESAGGGNLALTTLAESAGVGKLACTTRAKRKATEGCRSDDIELEDAPPPKVPRLLGPILQRRFRGIGRSSLSTSLLQS